MYYKKWISMMTSAWKNERNQLDVDNIKAELQICVNIANDCTQINR
jgi:hypothetical protein